MSLCLSGRSADHRGTMNLGILLRVSGAHLTNCVEYFHLCLLEFFALSKSKLYSLIKFLYAIFDIFMNQNKSWNGFWRCLSYLFGARRSF